MHLYHPIFEKIKNLINKKHIGEIVSVNLSFYCPHMEKSDFHWILKCYAICSFSEH